MTTLGQILKLLSEYTLNGSFQTNRKTKLSEIFKPIPNELKNYGVYIITERDKDHKNETIVYIGKNGTVNTEGQLGTHTLNKRIMQGKLKSRWLGSNDFKVYWFVTIEKTDSITNNITSNNIPSVVECKLLKTYFDIEKQLPQHNSIF